MEEEPKEGLFNIGALTFLFLWYFFSALTLFLNKHIVYTLKGDTALLGLAQMLMTLVFGYINMHLPCGFYKPVKRTGVPPNFYRNMILVGGCRFTTVVLGLIALKYVAVSFTETVKSSAPIFTVVIAKLLLGEDTSLLVNLSLVPIMIGLALTSAYELSFNIQGFLAALGTNITEWPAEMQFYTSLYSLVIQIPTCFFLMDFHNVKETTTITMIILLVFNGIFFHFQTLSAYSLMGYISPVTHSVANTVKRAFLIWLSVLVFGNSVTFLSGLGMVVVTIGVLLYNKARGLDAAAKAGKS